MAGGSEAALDGLRPLLATFSARVHHMGASGAGHTAKLLNNFLNGVSLAATAEVMVAARLAGLDLRTFLEVRQPLERRQLRHAQPLPAHRRGRLPGGRPDRRPDAQGHPAVRRAGGVARCADTRRRRMRRRVRARPQQSAMATRSPTAWSTRSAISRAVSGCRTHERAGRSAGMKINRGREAGLPSEQPHGDVHGRGLGGSGAPEHGRRDGEQRVLRARARARTGTATAPARSWS